MSQHQNKGQLYIIPQQQLEDTSAEEARILELSKAIAQISLLVADLESTAKELDANTLTTASDLLKRSTPKNLDELLSLLAPAGPVAN